MGGHKRLEEIIKLLVLRISGDDVLRKYFAS
jgi:hypothetical protein